MRTEVLVLVVIFGVAFASMPFYAATAARRGPDLLESSARGKFVLGGWLRSWFYWFIRPVEWLSIKLRADPLLFNVLGVLFAALGGVAFGFGYLSLGGWGVLLGGTMDVLDGRIARARDMVSEAGAFLDSTLDRFAEVGAFVGIAVLYRGSDYALVMVGLALGGSLLVSYARARGESLGVLCKGGVMQRAERIILVGMGGVFDPTVTISMGWERGTLLLGVIALVAVGTMGTAIYRTVWIARRLIERERQTRG